VEPHLAEDEDLQKLKTWWKKNGTSIIAGIALGVAAIAGVNGWRVYDQNRSETGSALYSQLREAIEKDESDKAKALFAELKEDFSATPYGPGGALLYAAHIFSNDDVSGARKLLTWTMETSEAASTKHTARLRLAWLELGEGNHQQVLKLTTVEENAGFESFYAELNASAYAMAGDTNKAAQHYDQAIASLPANSDYAEILQAKRNALKGVN
jgi:predicted negative regulator of RcsB-dependent stress response